MIYLAFAPCLGDHKSQHEAAHSLLRSMLSSLGYDEIDIKVTENGRPYTEADGVDFSISHSGKTALVCILAPDCAEIDNCFLIPCSGKRIGVDLERIDKNIDILAKRKLARRFLASDVASVEEFYRLWTRNEAYGKMTGEGVICQKTVACDILSFTVESEGTEYSLSIAIEQ